MWTAEFDLLIIIKYGYQSQELIVDHRGRRRRNDDLKSEVEGWILIEKTILLKHYGRSEMLTHQMQKKKKKNPFQGGKY